jgi:hypothetical protein
MPATSKREQSAAIGSTKEDGSKEEDPGELVGILEHRADTCSAATDHRPNKVGMSDAAVAGRHDESGDGTEPRSYVISIFNLVCGEYLSHGSELI